MMRQIRREAYGEDIGQHSRVGSEELRGDMHRLGLAPSSRLVDLGCGPCGPLTFVAALLDRLTHRAHILQFTGESFRFRQRMQRDARTR